MEKPLKIILVDDNHTFRNALKIILEQQYKAQIIGEATCAEEFWTLQTIRHADIILIDVMLPTVDGITIAKKILFDDRNIKIIAMTMHIDKVYLITLVEAGFLGCIFKDNLMNTLEPALDIVMSGGRFYPENIPLSIHHIKNH